MGYFYILTNEGNTSFYAGSTSNLKKRVYFHKKGLIKGHTKKYNLTRLVYFEVFSEVQVSRAREIQIKKAPQRKKIKLINSINPEWKDLSERL